MGTFGITDPQTDYKLSIENTQLGLQVNFPDVENQALDTITAYIACTETTKKAKAALYDNANPRNLIAVTNEVTLPIRDPQDYAWVTFTFASPPSMVANQQYLMVIWGESGDGLSELSYAYATAAMRTRREQNQIYNSFPDPWHSDASDYSLDITLYGTYSSAVTPYPVGQLVKGLVSGFHSFMNAYLKAKVGGYGPLKLPDGTLF